MTVSEAGTITVALGDLQESVDARLRTGVYASADEVVRAGLRALDREDMAAALPSAVREALDDPRPAIPAEQVFSDLRAHRAARSKGGRDGP